MKSKLQSKVEALLTSMVSQYDYYYVQLSRDIEKDKFYEKHAKELIKLIKKENEK